MLEQNKIRIMLFPFTIFICLTHKVAGSWIAKIYHIFWQTLRKVNSTICSLIYLDLKKISNHYLPAHQLVWMQPSSCIWGLSKFITFSSNVENHKTLYLMFLHQDYFTTTSDVFFPIPTILEIMISHWVFWNKWGEHISLQTASLQFHYT